MTNQELTSVWTLKETTAFEDALERRKIRQREAGFAYSATTAGQDTVDRGVPNAELPASNEQSGGLMIRVAGMAVGVVALAAIAAFGLTG